MPKIPGWTKHDEPPHEFIYYNDDNPDRVVYAKEDNDGLGLILDAFDENGLDYTETIWYEDFKNKKAARQFAKKLAMKYMRRHS